MGVCSEDSEAVVLWLYLLRNFSLKRRGSVEVRINELLLEDGDFDSCCLLLSSLRFLVISFRGLLMTRGSEATITGLLLLLLVPV